MLRTLVWPFIGLSAFGCAALPLFNELTDATPEQIIGHVRCELQDAYAALIGDYAFLKNWNVSYTLTAHADRVQVGGLDSGLVKFGTQSSLGATATASHQGTRRGTVKYGAALESVRGKDCSTPAEAHPDGKGLRGNLGIKTWLKDALAPSIEKEPAQTLGYSVSFLAKVDGSLRPGFVITNLTGTARLASTTTNSNTLELAFTWKSPPPQPQKVCIVDESNECRFPVAIAPAAAVPAENQVYDALRAVPGRLGSPDQ